MFTPRARYRFYGSPGNYVSAARHAVSRALGRDPDGRELLEARIAELVGVEHAICVPQARYGLYLIFAQLVKSGRPRVVMSPYTIHDVVNMVLLAGGQPVFCDIERDTCNIDAAQVEKLIDDQTGAVMITHLHGLACDVERILQVCTARGVPVVEDAAQAFGARVGGRWLGGFGRAGVFSFGRAKNINAFYGGMVVTSDAALARTIRDEVAANPDEDAKKLAKRIAHCLVGDVMTAPPVFSPLTFRLFRLGAVRGVKSVNKIVQTEDDPTRKAQLPDAYRRRLTSMQAHLIHEQLASVDELTAHRRELARIYHDGLSGERGIRLPPWREDGSHIYLQYPVQLEDRWDYVRYMMQHDRDLAIQHMASAAELEIFQDLRRDCPEARATAERVVLLPTYPKYNAGEAHRNVEVTRAYLRSRGGHGA
ncbi:MAG: DegT/DnrJ/EryC1/StrS family aminotransferase [Deltaproteobacteria bacterium]|nr:DegT/DnrJ/EryC1/StrS family aminotransferase [Deltaproteobacteria bacterium]